MRPCLQFALEEKKKEKHVLLMQGAADAGGGQEFSGCHEDLQTSVYVTVELLDVVVIP